MFYLKEKETKTNKTNANPIPLLMNKQEKQSFFSIIYIESGAILTMS